MFFSPWNLLGGEKGRAISLGSMQTAISRRLNGDKSLTKYFGQRANVEKAVWVPDLDFVTTQKRRDENLAGASESLDLPSSICSVFFVL